jgi:hypothetical protein
MAPKKWKRRPKHSDVRRKALLLSTEVANWLEEAAQQYQTPAGVIVDMIIRRYAGKFKP